ncbi:MAG: 50S ribosomal protein L10 [Methanophagales archaeon]|nr:50S ribosomal protein L10 [Methanophagales archaeon]MCW3140964.1 50S ribosomal protein L10 [Methanophagales archaeon]
MKAKKRVKRAKEWKREQVDAIKNLISSYKTVGIAKIRGLGSKQLQRIRKEFRDKARLRVSRNSLISISFRKSGMDEVVNFVDDQMALIFTDLDPFELYRVIEEGKIPAPIKPGAVAPHDIVIEEGPTSLKPGPIVGELQNLGIPAGITGGKVVIKQRKVAVRGGERVSPALAEMLARLEIHPIKEGLDLCAVYDVEGEVLYTPDVLHIDLSKYFSDVKEGVKAAFSLATRIKYDYPTRYTIGDLISEANVKSVALAFNIAYPTSVTIKPLIQKAYSNARNLSINACIYERETMAYLLAKACSQARSLEAYLGEWN